MPADFDSFPPDHRTRVQQMFIEHQDGLRAYALSIVRDFVNAQDVMQEVFLVISQKAHEFDNESNFMAWASTIVRFRALDVMRRTNKPTLSDETLSMLAVSDETQPDFRTESLANCIEKLTPTVQRLLRLRYEDAMKPSEIARLIGWTANAVNVATSRARSELRKCIEQIQLKEGLS